MKVYNKSNLPTRYKELFKESLNTQQEQSLLWIIKRLESDTRIDYTHIASYMLATVKHECANTYLPIKERGGRIYLSKYAYTTEIGKSLGNTKPGDDLKYPGQGFVMITGRGNYDRMGKRIKLNLIDNPQLVLVPQYAYEIMVVGMIEGLFTGRKIGKYINTDIIDLLNARRVINGLDRAELIKQYAEKFHTLIDPWG